MAVSLHHTCGNVFQIVTVKFTLVQVEKIIVFHHIISHNILGDALTHCIHMFGIQNLYCEKTNVCYKFPLCLVVKYKTLVKKKNKTKHTHTIHKINAALL